MLVTTFTVICCGRRKLISRGARRGVALTPFRNICNLPIQSHLLRLSFSSWKLELLCPKVYPEKNSEIHFCVTPKRTECRIELAMSFTTNNWSSQVETHLWRISQKIDSNIIQIDDVIGLGVENTFGLSFPVLALRSLILCILTTAQLL